MKERPILFNGSMVRALLSGSKTQTRRVTGLEVINAEPDRYEFRGITSGPGVPHFAFHDRKSGAHVLVKCRHGQPGDRLWVRETFAIDELEGGSASINFKADHSFYRAYRRDVEGIPFAKEWILQAKDRGHCFTPEKWRPSIFMPRWASRITLEVVSVRVERLQDISRGDAMDEGCPFPNMAQGDNPRHWYAELWESINGPGSWDANPWVWVAEFRRLT